ncbi:MAG: lytic murein transglycosylase [Mesorhizobium sp.]|nr:MAG: lytic murein transglycosylase [Mesorhizobium sp.]
MAKASCVAFLHTPLCPAGHLPRKGGDQLKAMLSPITGIAGWAAAWRQPISLLAGEMAGRPEGGAWAKTIHR